VDLIIDLGQKLIPVELKSSRTMASDFFNGLKYWLSLKGNSQDTGFLVYAGEENYRREGIHVKSWYECS
jgi:hypothetical protein